MVKIDCFIIKCAKCKDANYAEIDLWSENQTAVITVNDHLQWGEVAKVLVEKVQRLEKEKGVNSRKFSFDFQILHVELASHFEVVRKIANALTGNEFLKNYIHF